MLLNDFVDPIGDGGMLHIFILVCSEDRLLFLPILQDTKRNLINGYFPHAVLCLRQLDNKLVICIPGKCFAHGNRSTIKEIDILPFQVLSFSFAESSKGKKPEEGIPSCKAIRLDTFQEVLQLLFRVEIF